MNLLKAFSIQPKEVVAFVGGGGKTSAMFRLAEELAQNGKRVVTTTTTRIFASQIQLAPFHIFAESNDQVLRDVRAALAEHPNLLVIGATNEDGRALGINTSLVDALIALGSVDTVLVEADGSRMRPFKAPAAHEPVIPQSTTLLVPVVGVDALGVSLTAERIHRAERVAQLLEISLGTILSPEHIAQVLGHPEGGLKNKPVQARVIPFINKVESETQLADARRVGHLLLQNDSIDAVAIGVVRNSAQPVTEVQARVAGIILAAGGSTRMQGGLKQLLPWGDSTLVRNAVNIAEQSEISELIVVTGNRADEVIAQVAGTQARVVHNPAWKSGRASSVRTGIAALSDQSAAAIFINADQPFLTPQVIDTIIEKFYATIAPIVVPTYKSKTGSPVLFARTMFEEMNALQGEEGGRDLLQKHRAELEKLEIADTRAATDLDTPEEYRTGQRMAQSARTE